MLTKTKQIKLLNALKIYNKKFFSGKLAELDESGTRLMINYFLTEVLGFIPIEEVKTEYMIKGTYADYVVQTKGLRHFLVEVKSLSFDLSGKHLRQAINYGANEGIEYALLTNGKKFDFYKIILSKSIEEIKVFSLDLSNATELKNCLNVLQYLHRDSVLDKGLHQLWNKTIALDPRNIAGLLYTQPVLNFIKRVLKKKFRNNFSDEEIINSINRVVNEEIKIEDIKHTKIRKLKKKSNSNGEGAKLIQQNSVSIATITPSKIAMVNNPETK
jgi:hypothetical protein